jgi:S1-C subfamily serine protease
MSEDQIKSLGIPTNVEGVYVSAVSPGGGASEAGIRKGDIITKVNGVSVVSGIQMSAQIASFRPGDKVSVSFVRNGKENSTSVQLKKKSDVITANAATRLGGEFVTLDKKSAEKYGLSGGVVVNKVFDGSILKNSRIDKGFIITSVVTSEGEQEVNSVDELNEVLQNLSGTIRVRGVYPDYGEAFTYPLNLEQ